jgi:hypothetical protein
LSSTKKRAAASDENTESVLKKRRIYSIRHDTDGPYYRLITAWKATHEEEQSYAENV